MMWLAKAIKKKLTVKNLKNKSNYLFISAPEMLRGCLISEATIIPIVLYLIAIVIK